MIGKEMVLEGGIVQVNAKKKKWYTLGRYSLILSAAILVLTYFVFHYMRPDGTFGPLFQEEPAKPFVTLLLGIWGVMFMFAAVMSFLAGKVFCEE